MKIDAKSEGKWKVVMLSGRFDAGNSKTVEDEITHQIDKGFHYIALDLTEVPFLSSAGLRVMLAARKNLKNIDGNLVLVNPQENVNEVLDLSGFSNIFFIVNSIEGLL